MHPDHWPKATERRTLERRASAKSPRLPENLAYAICFCDLDQRELEQVAALTVNTETPELEEAS